MITDAFGNPVPSVPVSYVAPGSDASSQLAVVLDAFGTPVPGATVTLSVQPAASGTLAQTTAVSDDNGDVSTTVTAGATPGAFNVIGNVATGISAMAAGTLGMFEYAAEGHALLRQRRYDSVRRVTTVGPNWLLWGCCSSAIVESREDRTRHVAVADHPHGDVQ